MYMYVCRKLNTDNPKAAGHKNMNRAIGDGKNRPIMGPKFKFFADKDLVEN